MAQGPEGGDPGTCQCTLTRPTWRREISLKSYYIPMTIPLADAGIFVAAPVQTRASVPPVRADEHTPNTRRSHLACVVGKGPGTDRRRQNLSLRHFVCGLTGWWQDEGATFSNSGTRHRTNCMRETENPSLAGSADEPRLLEQTPETRRHGKPAFFSPLGAI
ncbi:hypothetical protein VTI74DRAFT_8738 [Chaetomium olivicolor]